MVPQSTTSKQDWWTPPWVVPGFAALGLQRDVCAAAENALLPLYWTEEDNCLEQVWDLPWWDNPPYRYAGKIVRHSIEQVHATGQHGVHLLRVPSIGTKWWMECAPFCLTAPLNPRINFIDSLDPEKVSCPHGSMFMFVTPKTIAAARQGITPVVPMLAESAEDIHAWLVKNWALLF